MDMPQACLPCRTSRLFLTLLITIGIATALSGCSSNEESTSHTIVPEEQSSTAQEDPIPNQESDTSVSLAQAQKKQGTYVKRGDRYYYASSYINSLGGDCYKEGSDERLWHLSEECYEKSCLTTALNRPAGDELITTEYQEYWQCYPVLEDGYCSSQIYGIASDGIYYSYVTDTGGSASGKHTEINGEKVDGNAEELLALSGISVNKDFIPRLSSDRHLLIGNEGSSFSYGFWDGTVHKTKETALDYRYIITGSLIDKLPIEKTSDGYFILDTTSLEAGRYLINRCIVEIV